jgi:hypothetical protein
MPALAGYLPYDATGHTVTLTMKRPDGSLLSKTATIGTYDEDEGRTPISFAWSSTDLQAGERQKCEVRDVNGSSSLTYPPFFLFVRERNA